MPTEDDVILNSRLEHLYNNEFGNGRYFQVVFDGENEAHIQVSSRILMKVIYIKERDDIRGLEIVKALLSRDKERITDKERIFFSDFNLQQLKTFLKFISSIDLKGISQRRIRLSDYTLDDLDDKTKRQLLTLLSGKDGSNLVKQVLTDGLITQ